MPVCWLDPNSKQLSLCAESLEAPPAPWEQLLLWAVPHMLTLLRRDVLHASAVVLDGAAIAFCGSSGVGKTTLARTLTEQGATRASEDLVLLGSDGKSTHIVVGAEAILRAWAAESGPELAFKGRIRTDGLAAAAEGSRVPLQAVYFLDRFRRRTPSFERITLSPAAALVNLLENGFAELGQPPIWRQLLTASERLAREVKMFKLKCPEGVEELRRAAATYNWITKS